MIAVHLKKIALSMCFVEAVESKYKVLVSFLIQY